MSVSSMRRLSAKESSTCLDDTQHSYNFRLPECHSLLHSVYNVIILYLVLI